MIAWLARPLRSLRDTLEFGDTPRQIAMGVALGMVLGLVPKGNLMCVALCLAALSVRVNLGAVMVSAVAFSLISPLADPLTHRIGLKLLTWDFIKPAFDALYNVPLAPWTAFNNTVVLGSFALGLMMFLPTYWICRQCLERTAVAPPVKQRELAPTISRTYVAATTPIRIDHARRAFQSTLAMADPANSEEIVAKRDQISVRIEEPHSTPAPAAPIFTAESMPTSTPSTPQS